MSDLPSVPGSSGNMLVSDAQAQAIEKLADFGTTVVEETGQLARYVGKVLGTVPHDAVGLILGDPLRFIRTVIAAKLDTRVGQILSERNVVPQRVSPSLAIPLLRAAYDESRSELQELWAQLIAAAMDPARSHRVRRSYIDILPRLDPLDALVLKTLRAGQTPLRPNARDYLAQQLVVTTQEIEISFQNLMDLKCVRLGGSADQVNSYISAYGFGLLSACSD